MVKQKRGVFDWIAPVYGLFYNYQVSRFNQLLDGALKELGLLAYETIIDVGCGTGTLCSVLDQRGLRVTGVDGYYRMA